MNTLTILNREVRSFGSFLSLNDLHQASGGEDRHRPVRFMRLEQTKDLISEINERPDLVFDVKRGGTNSGTWVCKELVYAYAMWISAKFHLQVIHAFDSLVSQPLTTLTSAQKLEIRKAVGKKAHNHGESHKRVYHALYNHFSVSEYGDIQQDQFEEAIEFINSLDITPRVTQTGIPFFCTRVLVTIENGNVTQSQVPDDAFVFSKAKLPQLLKDSEIFSLEDLAQIAQVAQSRMVNMVLPKQLPSRNW